MPDSLKRVLVINQFGIGDVLFTTPLIESIKKQIDGCRIGFLCNRRTEPLFKESPLVEWRFVFEKDEYRRLWRESKLNCTKKFISLLKDIKAKKFDAVIDLSLSRQYGFLMWAIGIRRRIGYNYRKRGIFLTDKIDVEGYHDKHIADYYLDLLGLMDLKPTSKEIKVYVAEQDRRWAKDFLAANAIGEDDVMVGIVPAGGASWGKDAEIKHWKKEGFARVSDRLAAELNAKIVIFGSSAETDICKAVIMNMKHPAVAAFGKTTLLQSAAMMELCDLVIANDGGPLHLAVAAGAKTVGIFGPVDDKVYGQYPPSKRHKVVKCDMECRPCYKKFKYKDCQARICLDSITSDEVFNVAREVLKI